MAATLTVYPERAKARPTGGMGRLTRPTYYDPYVMNGVGIVPRRGIDHQSRQFLSGEHSDFHLANFAATWPLRLLSLLKDTHPLIGQAWSNNQRLAFAPGDTQIVAEKPAGSSGGRVQVDDAGTEELDRLWEAHGGLGSLQATWGDQAMCFGLACVEAVPGPRAQGLSDVLAFDPLSVRFRRGRDREPPLVMQQYQIGMWEDLPPATVRGFAVDGSRDNPYGRPLFSAVLTEALGDLSLQRSLRDVLHSVAWPRLSVGFDLEMLVTFANENFEQLGILPPGSAQQADGALTAVQWALAQYGELQALMETLKAADTFIFPKGSEVNALNPGSLQGTQGVLAMQRHRLVMAVDQPPNMLGITDGGTQAYASTQWKTFAAKLEWLRAFVNSILVWLANLHFRLLGEPLTARAETQPIRTEDVLVEQNARTADIRNERDLIAMGFTTAEEASVKLTGSGVADPERAARIGAPVAPAPTGVSEGEGAAPANGGDGGGPPADGAPAAAPGGGK